jgi:hypothetical protein
VQYAQWNDDEDCLKDCQNDSHAQERFPNELPGLDAQPILLFNIERRHASLDNRLVISAGGRDYGHCGEREHSANRP